MKHGPLVRVLLTSVAAAIATERVSAQTLEDPSEALLHVGAVYTGEVFAGLAGGLEQDAAYLHNVDLTATISLDTFRSWGGPRIHVHLLGNHGQDPSSFIGDAQTVSNISAESGWTLFELNAEQTLLRDRASLLLGLYDLNSEFDASDVGGFFVNSSFGIGAEFGASGLNGPSIFPVTSLGARLRWRPAPGLYFQTAALDGAPGDPERSRRTHVRFSSHDGALLAFEAGIFSGASPRSPADARDFITRRDDPPTTGRLSVGAWHYTSTFPSMKDTSATLSASTGAYLLAEGYMPFVDVEAMRCFGRIGWADPRSNRFVGSISGGCVYEGLLPGIPEDAIGMAVSRAVNGSHFKDAQRRNAIPTATAETVIEVAYALTLTSFLAAMADLQFVIDPDASPDIRDAIAAGVRLQITL